MTAFSAILKKLAIKEELSDGDLESSFDLILSGALPPEQVGAFLMGLAQRGETAKELYAGSKVMRRNVKKIDLEGPVLDTCGTGGLGWTTLNTSTAAAIVVAACGGKVAKHGNRSVPPKTGSADVLEALGVSIDVTEEQFRKCIEKAGVGFLFARTHHAAMKHVAPIRASLGIRTIFNLLGPLSNPSFAKRQLLGVYDKVWLEPMAGALLKLGVERAWVVHGVQQDSLALDELSIAGTSLCIEVTPAGLKYFEIMPEHAGITKSDMKNLKGGSPQDNAEAIKQAFRGEPSSFADSISLNAGSGLVLLDIASDLTQGVSMAQNAMKNGCAESTLQSLIQASNSKD